MQYEQQQTPRAGSGNSRAIAAKRRRNLLTNAGFTVEQLTAALSLNVSTPAVNRTCSGG